MYMNQSEKTSEEVMAAVFECQEGLCEREELWKAENPMYAEDESSKTGEDRLLPGLKSLVLHIGYHLVQQQH